MQSGRNKQMYRTGRSVTDVNLSPWEIINLDSAPEEGRGLPRVTVGGTDDILEEVEACPGISPLKMKICFVWV
jgi:hypothetical protein